MSDTGKTEEARLEEARLEVARAMAQTLDLYGYSPSTGMLYSHLYFSDEPMSLDELAEKLEVSKTTVCNSARSMEERGMLDKSWKPGSRRDYYRAETDFFNNFINYFSSMWQREIDVNTKAIAKTELVFRELAAGEDPDVSSKAKADLQKIEEARCYYRWLEKMVKALESGDIFKYIPVNDNAT